MAGIQNIIAQGIAFGYLVWGKLPTGAQAALRHLFYAGLGFALAFSFTLPANLAGLKVEALLFWQGLAQVLQAIIDKEVLPNLLTWLVEILGLKFTTEPGAKHKRLVRK
jgi:hypothetical protein